MIELPRLFNLVAVKAKLAQLGADVSTDTLRREIDRGRLRPTWIGRKLFIREDHLQDYLSCQDQTDPRKSADTGSASATIPPTGVEPGLTQQLDRLNAHRLAQRTFSKPN
jgi:hypothetical protein